MYVTVNGARLFFDVIGQKLAPDGNRMCERPTVLLLHGGPGFDHSMFKPAFAPLADVAQLVSAGFGQCGELQAAFGSQRLE